MAASDQEPDKEPSRPGAKRRATRQGRRAAPAARPSGQPSERVLVRRGQRWHVRLSAFGPGAPPDLARLRELAQEAGRPPGARDGEAPPRDRGGSGSEPSSSDGPEPGWPARGEPRDRGGTPAARLPDDLLIAAAAAGATASLAFLDILDSGDFDQAPCLCCYSTGSARSARKASQALLLFERYYDAESYLASRAFTREVAALAGDLAPGDLATIKAHLAGLRQTSDVLRAINAHPEICATVPPCQPEVVWVYSTQGGRRMLRHLARGFNGERRLSVSVASSADGVYPRWRYRMYAAVLVEAGPPGPPEKAAGGARLLAAMAAWAQASLA